MKMRKMGEDYMYTHRDGEATSFFSNVKEE